MPVIGITDNLRPSYDHYPCWVRRLAPSCEIVKLSPQLRNQNAIERCDALLLTGGGDVHPKHYRCQDTTGLTEGVNEERDEFEFRLIDRALGRELPVLGICRGMQILNVALGGSLILDVQQAGYSDHGRGKDDCTHDAELVAGTILSGLVRGGKGSVNTRHHQAVDRIGRGLTVAARAGDGIIEALEAEKNKQAPFLLLVQWHPERMPDFENPLCGGILQSFMDAVTSRLESSNVNM